MGPLMGDIFCWAQWHFILRWNWRDEEEICIFIWRNCSREGGAVKYTNPLPVFYREKELKLTHTGRRSPGASGGTQLWHMAVTCRGLQRWSLPKGVLSLTADLNPPSLLRGTVSTWGSYLRMRCCLELPKLHGWKTPHKHTARNLFSSAGESKVLSPLRFRVHCRRCVRIWNTPLKGY